MWAGATPGFVPMNLICLACCLAHRRQTFFKEYINGVYRYRLLKSSFLCLYNIETKSQTNEFSRLPELELGGSSSRQGLI